MNEINERRNSVEKEAISNYVNCISCSCSKNCGLTCPPFSPPTFITAAVDILIFSNLTCLVSSFTCCCVFGYLRYRLVMKHTKKWREKKRRKKLKLTNECYEKWNQVKIAYYQHVRFFITKLCWRVSSSFLPLNTKFAIHAKNYSIEKIVQLIKRE